MDYVRSAYQNSGEYYVYRKFENDVFGRNLKDNSSDMHDRLLGDCRLFHNCHPSEWQGVLGASKGISGHCHLDAPVSQRFDTISSPWTTTPFKELCRSRHSAKSRRRLLLWGTLTLLLSARMNPSPCALHVAYTLTLSRRPTLPS